MTALLTYSVYTPPNWLDPLDWLKVFENSRPIEVDVGCGKGSFLLWAAQSNSERNFLGIERQLGRLRRIDKKVRRLGLQNVRLIRIEAGYLIGKLIPVASVQVYHIYFPDPWPKRRHHRRRLFTQGFVSDLHRTLCAGGTVNIATDFEEYFAWIQAEMMRMGGVAEREPVAFPPEAETDFEREFLANGKQICRSRWDKV
jgi:tRNA (guanine-N7-)-methyltransferase